MTVTISEKQTDEIKNENAKKPQLCKKKKVLEAISVLKQLNEKFLADEAKKQSLLEETYEIPVLLQITLKKIPHKKLMQMIKVPLPHSLVTDTTEVCLFTGDTDKSNRKAEIEPDVLYFKELLKKHGITKVTEIITLRQLRTEYKVYEARRQLMAAYDVFLADQKIAQCLPRILGKIFFKKRKFPIQINMKRSNLKDQIEKALSATVFDLTCRGNTCTSTVARLGMEDKEILENILASIKVLADRLPGQWNNVSGVYVKTAKSQGIPIYLSFGDPNEVKLQKPYVSENVEEEELSTLPHALVKVFKDGRIQVRNHVDSDEEDIKNSDELKPKVGKKRKRNAEISNDDSDSESHSSHKKKKASKKSLVQEFDSNEIRVQEIANEFEDVQEESSKTKLKKKAHKSKAIIQEEIEEGNEVEQEESTTSKKKLKKKAYKLKAEIHEIGVDNEVGKKKGADKKSKGTNIDEENPSIILKKKTKSKVTKTHQNLDSNSEIYSTVIKKDKVVNVKRKFSLKKSQIK